jgi:UDP-N-acetylmuramate--alanine ligase
VHEGPVVVFAGGGTGGHLYPALALAEELVRQRPDVRPFFFGARRGIEARVLPERGLENRLLPVRGIGRGEWWSNLAVPFALASSLGTTIGIHRRIRPELVVVTGGYAGAPAGLVAAGLGTPLVLQEQNAWPGVTTRFLSRWATQIHLAFPEALAELPPRARTVAQVSGCPIRALPDATPDRHDALVGLGLDPQQRLLLLIGGSQGSLALNDLMLEAVRSAAAGSHAPLDGWQLLWMTGPAHHSSIIVELSALGDPAWVRAVPYIEDVPLVLGVTDLALSRAGAMTTAEISAWGVPAILVPLPTAAANHQELNARALQRAGAAMHLEQEGLTAGTLWSTIAGLAGDRQARATMSERARHRSRPDATSLIVRDMVGLLPDLPSQGVQTVDPGSGSHERDLRPPNEQDQRSSNERDLRRLSNEGRIHLMGVGGAGMCALAELFVKHGGSVSGCDLRPGSTTDRLRTMDVEIHEGHEESHVQGAVALIVSAAVPRDHPEVQAALEQGIPVFKRAEALGQWVNRGRVLAVAGTHGKTSTTAMTTEILVAAGMDPTGFVGGRVHAWGGNLRSGGDLFVVEADEYDRSFLELKPTVAVVTNVEADHLDIYGAFQGVLDAFNEFLDGLSGNGYAVICTDDPGASRLVTDLALNLASRVRTYGLESGSQVRAVDVEASPVGMDFRVMEDGVDCGTFRLPVPGVHNLRNALGAATAARCFGVDWDAVREGLTAYRGVERRFDTVGLEKDILIVDDYAHHPSEIQATLAAARGAYPSRRIVAVFQPHLFTRTRDFAEEFGQTLAEADSIWVTDVFPAREAPIEGVTGEMVALAAGRAGGDVCYHADVDTLADTVLMELAAGDLLLTMGAGSIDNVAREVMARLKEISHA